MFTDDIIEFYKIQNGSRIDVGNYYKLEIKVDKHFNWFQKKMIKLCFGFNVYDYSEGED